MRRVLALVTLIALALGACKKGSKQQTSIVYKLDCTPGFEALKAKIVATPGIVQAPKNPGEPYEWYNTADQTMSYVITEPGAPGHPAILMQVAAGGREMTMGCPYGDQKGYAKVLAYVESLKATHK